jgi:hypothetical protein
MREERVRAMSRASIGVDNALAAELSKMAGSGFFLQSGKGARELRFGTEQNLHPLCGECDQRAFRHWL